MRSPRPGSTPTATEMSCTSCEVRIWPGATSQVFRILPRSGITAWNSRSRACLADPPAESPSTRNSSDRSGSSETQSASFPGRVGPAAAFLRTTAFAARARALARAITCSASRSPVSVCWLSQRLSSSFTTPETKAAHSREESRSLVWPVNCGSTIFTERTYRHVSHTSSGASFTPRGRRLRNSQYSRSASVRPDRRPFTCVPPWGVGIRLT